MSRQVSGVLPSVTMGADFGTRVALWLDQFLPRTELMSPADHHRARMLVRGSIGLACIGVLALVFRALLAPIGGSELAALAVVILGFGMTPAVVRFTGSPTLMAWLSSITLLVALSVLAVANQGIRDPVVNLFAVLPFIGMLFGGRRVSMGVSGVTFVLIVFLVGLDYTLLQNPEELTAVFRHGLTVTLVVTISFGIAYLHNSISGSIGSQLAASFDRDECALDAAGIGVFEWDIREQTVSYSETFKRLLGLKNPDIAELKHPFPDWLVAQQDQSALSKAIQFHLINQKPLSLNVRLVSSEWRDRWFRVEGKALRRVKQVNKLVGIIRDVDDEVRGQLMREEQALSSESEARKVFSSLTDTMRQITTEARLDARTSQELFSTAKRGVDHLKDIVSTTVTETVLEGDADLKMELLPVSGILTQNKALNRAFSEAFKVELKYEDRAKGVTVKADIDRLHEALSAVVISSIERTHKNGTVVIRAEAMRKRVMFSVHDKGGGVPDAVADSLLKSDRVVETAEQRVVNEFGSTYFWAKEYIEVMGGDVRLHNTPGKGTTFYFSLPTS